MCISVKKTLFLIKVKNVVNIPEDPRDDGHRLQTPVRHPFSEVTQTRFLYMTQVVMRTGGITTMPRAITRVSI